MVLSNSNMFPVLNEISISTEDENQSRKDLNFLYINPIQTADIQPASVDLHLDAKILADTGDCELIKPGQTTPGYHSVDITNEPYVLFPKQFILASTVEEVSLNETVSGLVIGKSSLMRLGLTVAPGLIDPGFRGTITLEIFNASNNRIELTAGMPITQLVTFILADPAYRKYGDQNLQSKYQDQKGPTPPKVISDERN